MTDNESASKPQQQTLWNRDFILILLISLFTFVGFQMLMPTLPMFAKQLGGSDATAGLVIGVFAISALLARPVSGYALDRFGRQYLLFAGLLLFTISTIAYHQATTLLILLMIRFVHGFAWGLGSTASSTVATDLIPKGRLGEGMGYFGLASTASMALAPAAGLWIVSNAGFDALFSVSTAMVAIAVALTFVIRYPAVGLSEHTTFSLLEKTAIKPAVVIFFLTMTYGAIVSFLALYANQIGISNIGPFFSVYAIALFVTRPMAGKLSDKKGFDIMVIPGIVCVMAAMIVLALSDTMNGFLVAAALYGVGFGAAMPSLQALSVIATPPDRRGAANSTFFIGFDLGIGLSSILWGAVSQAVGYSMMFLYTLLPTLAALAFYLLNRPKVKRGS